MYKHTNKGNGVITISDDEGNQHVFMPGGTVSLDKRYTKFEAYSIYCEDEQITIPEEKPKKTNKRKEMIENDSSDS